MTISAWPWKRILGFALLLIGWIASFCAGLVTLAALVSCVSQASPVSRPALGVLAALSLHSMGSLVRNAGRKFLIKTAAAVLESDARPIVLYLRGFSDDKLKAEEPDFLPFVTDHSSFERSLLSKLNQFGPVVGLAEPSGRTRPVGFAHWFSDEATWKSDVLELMKEAQVLVVLLNHSLGLIWEVEALLRKGYLRKTVLFFPPTRDENREEIWRAMWMVFLKLAANSDAPSWMQKEANQTTIFDAELRKKRTYEEDAFCVWFSLTLEPRFYFSDFVWPNTSGSRLARLSEESVWCVVRSPGLAEIFEKES